MRRPIPNVWLALSLSLMAFPAPAAALPVTNSEFDSDASGWTGQAAKLQSSWDPSDYAGSPSSGSMAVTNSAATTYNAGVQQCISPVAPDQDYELSVEMRTPSGQQAGDSAGAFFTFFTGANCIGTQTESFYTAYTNSDGSSGQLDTWLRRSGAGLAPASTQSGWIYLNLYHVGGPTPFVTRFDHISLEPILFRDGFESSDLSKWSTHQA